MSLTQSTAASRQAEAGRPVRRLRLLVVNSIRDWGGGEKWLLTTARGLAGRGHHVALVCQPGSALELASLAALGSGLWALGSEPDPELPGEPRGPSVRGGTWFGAQSPEPRAGSAPEGRLSTHAVAMPHDLSVRAFYQLTRLCRQVRPDVVLLCNQRAARLAAPAARVAGVSTVVMRNGLEGAFAAKRWNRFLAGRFISHFVCNAEALRAEILSFDWVSSERVRVIYNGVEPDRLRPRLDRAAARAALGLAAEHRAVLCVARLAEGKGQDDLIRAVPELIAAVPGLSVLLAGEGPYRARLEQLAGAMGVADWVRFLGFRDDVPDLLLAADVVVIASHREGLPNIALEAMALRLPVVATAVSGTPEAVIDGETGLLVPPREPSMLSSAVRRLLSDPESARAMGDRAHDRVRAEFDAGAALDRWEEYLLGIRRPEAKVEG